MSVSFDLEVAGLYRLDPADFVAARNALEKRIRASGDRALASEVKALVRPSSVAWAANQLYWQDRPRHRALVDAGTTVISAITSGRPEFDSVRPRRT